MSLTAGIVAFADKDYANAFKLLKPLADRGDAEAQCIIANMYHLGLGRQRNITEAVKWYEKSAAQGYVAANNLAGILTSGDRHLEIDLAKAAQWYRTARKQGFLHAPNC